jgi:hypothetical protein
MLFPRFKLQLPENFRTGIEVPHGVGIIEEECVCGCPASTHSTANVRTVKRLREPFEVTRVDIRWKRCDGRIPGGKCLCPGFWRP